MRILFLILITALLSACATAPLDIQRSELGEARALIAKSKAAGAERCAPEQQATAVAMLYMAAHEYSEGDVHPEEQRELVEGSMKAAREAYLVARKGCSKKAEIITLEGVYFETNSDKLTAASVAILNGAVSTLQRRSSVHVEVAAHTDSRGSAAYNLDLSNRRAASVMAYLTEHGVDAGRLTSKGYGESSPITDNESAAGRAKNRRVELRIQ